VNHGLGYAVRGSLSHQLLAPVDTHRGERCNAVGQKIHR